MTVTTGLTVHLTCKSTEPNRGIYIYTQLLPLYKSISLVESLLEAGRLIIVIGPKSMNQCVQVGEVHKIEKKK